MIANRPVWIVVPLTPWTFIQMLSVEWRRVNHVIKQMPRALLLWNTVGLIIDSMTVMFSEEDQWHLVYGQYMKKTGPGPRHHHSATLHENMMFIIGGINGLQLFNDTWVYNFGRHQLLSHNVRFSIKLDMY